MVILTVVVFAGLLLVLVLAHEWGHFAAARLVGCRVEEFAFGFPPRLVAVQRGETRYVFNALPLGGYVKIEGEDMDEARPGPRSFGSKAPGQRLLVLAAGVLMNVVLAATVLTVQAGLGVPTLATSENEGQLHDLQTFIVSVEQRSPGAAAGLAALDRIAAIDEIEGPTVEQTAKLLRERAGQPVTVRLERGGLGQTVTVTPRVDPPPGEGALGIALQALGLRREVWWRAPLVGVERTWEMLASILQQFWQIMNRLVTERAVEEALTGPVGIALYTHEVTQLGVSYILEFAALISLNLALINVLPFPALDGGRMLFVGIEVLAGRRVPRRVEHATHLTGFMLLLVLMLLITFRDIRRFF